jgi:hypothetical protein
MQSYTLPNWEGYLVYQKKIRLVSCRQGRKTLQTRTCFTAIVPLHTLSCHISPERSVWELPACTAEKCSFTTRCTVEGWIGTGWQCQPPTTSYNMRNLDYVRTCAPITCTTPGTNKKPTRVKAATQDTKPSTNSLAPQGTCGKCKAWSD